MQPTKALLQMARAPILKDTFAQHFYKHATITSQGPILQFAYTLPTFMLDQHQRLSTGAANTIIDAATTVHLLQKTLNRTISISLSGRYLREMSAENGKQLEVRTQIGKMGKQICFTRAEGILNKEVVFRGEHVKKVLEGKWQF